MRPTPVVEGERELLCVEGLAVAFPVAAGTGSDTGSDTGTGSGVEVVRDATFTVRRGELVGLVGESGCGKSMTALALLGLLPPGGEIVRGSARLAAASGARPETGAIDLARLDEAGWQRLRGRRLAMIFQEPRAALNPLLSVGRQLREVLARHRGLRGSSARREAIALLERVALPEPARALASHPHQLSGGQRQRVMIALALASGPDLLLADEPTTALDVTIQAQILELLADLRRELDLAILLISHDLGVIAGCCDRVAVMYAGEVVESAGAATFFAGPEHPYARALLAARPRLGRTRPAPGIPGQVPEPGALPPGCAFAPRCAEVFERCRREAPALVDRPGARRTRCFLYPRTDLPESAAGAVP